MRPRNSNNGVMVRRTKRRSAPQRDDNRSRGLGEHWRADGAPKRGYRTRDDALAMAEDRRRESGVQLSVYRCEVCAAWHMGSSGGRHER
jgi:hypothetical protein